MPNMQTMEMLSFDDDGEPICRAINTRYIELKIKGYDLLESNDFCKYLENNGLILIASGIYTNGTIWYRFKVDYNAKEKQF